MRPLALIVLGIILAKSNVAAAAATPTPPANPFDPRGFISEKAVETAVEDNTLSRRANYRFDGKRFQRFDAGSDTVYFPLAGDKLELREELALCPGHLQVFSEVLLIRDKMPIDAEIKKREKEIVTIAKKCREAKLAGPAAAIDQGVLQDVNIKPKPEANGRPQGAEATIKLRDR